MDEIQSSSWTTYMVFWSFLELDSFLFSTGNRKTNRFGTTWWWDVILSELNLEHCSSFLCIGVQYCCRLTVALSRTVGRLKGANIYENALDENEWCCVWTPQLVCAWLITGSLFLWPLRINGLPRTLQLLSGKWFEPLLISKSHWKFLNWILSNLMHKLTGPHREE